MSDAERFIEATGLRELIRAGGLCDSLDALAAVAEAMERDPAGWDDVVPGFDGFERDSPGRYRGKRSTPPAPSRGARAAAPGSSPPPLRRLAGGAAKESVNAAKQPSTPASKPASGAAGGVTSRVAESASAGETDEAPWQTLTPGELRRRLLDAAAAGESVEILYVNSRDVTQPRTVRPKTVQTRGRAEWLVTHSGASGDAPEFRVDRIVGLR
jgi:hypothetical protein